MNPFEFVLAIIVITGIFSIIRARMVCQASGAGVSGTN